jgi:hypothetical protein
VGVDSHAAGDGTARLRVRFCGASLAVIRMRRRR